MPPWDPQGHYVPEDYEGRGYSGFVAGKIDIIERWVNQGHHVAVTYENWYNNAAIEQCNGERPRGDRYVWFISIGDTDGDGCVDGEELAGAASPKPGATGAYDPLAWYDFYDVPVPANPDPTPNGGRNGAVTLGDVLATLLYVATCDGCAPNANGVDYDSLKDGDWFDGVEQAMYPDGLLDEWDEVGRRYDRSPSAEPNPPWEAGPPSGAISMGDVLAILAQVGLSCSGPPNDEPPEPPSRVLIYHGNGGASPDDNPGSPSAKYFSLEAHYQPLGYPTDYTDIFPSDLRPYRLIILPTPGDDDDSGVNYYSDDQVDALRSFVLAGGRLVVLGDWGGHFGINTLNDLLERLNAEITQNADEPVPDADSCAPITDPAAYASHQITDGILAAGGLDPSASSSLTVAGDGTVLVTSVGDDECPSDQGLPIMAVEKIPGAPPGPGGDIVVTGDLNVLDDKYGFGDPAGDGNAGNIKLAENLVGY